MVFLSLNKIPFRWYLDAMNANHIKTSKHKLNVTGILTDADGIVPRFIRASFVQKPSFKLHYLYRKHFTIDRYANEKYSMLKILRCN